MKFYKLSELKVTCWMSNSVLLLHFYLNFSVKYKILKILIRYFNLRGFNSTPWKIQLWNHQNIYLKKLKEVFKYVKNTGKNVRLKGFVFKETFPI